MSDEERGGLHVPERLPSGYRRLLRRVRGDRRAQLAALLMASACLLGLAAIVHYPLTSVTIVLDASRVKFSVARDTTLRLDGMKVDDLVIAGLSHVQYDGVERVAQRVFVDPDQDPGTPSLRYLELARNATMSIAATEHGELHLVTDRQRSVLTVAYDGRLVRSTGDASETFETAGAVVMTATEQPLEILAKPSERGATLSLSDFPITDPRFVEVEHQMVGGRFATIAQSAVRGGSVALPGFSGPVALRRGDLLQLGDVHGFLQRLVANGSSLTITMKLYPAQLVVERADDVRDLRPTLFDWCSEKGVLRAWGALLALVAALRSGLSWWRGGTA